MYYIDINIDIDKNKDKDVNINMYRNKDNNKWLDTCANCQANIGSVCIYIYLFIRPNYIIGS